MRGQAGPLPTTRVSLRVTITHRRTNGAKIVLGLIASLAGLSHDVPIVHVFGGNAKRFGMSAYGYKQTF